MRNKVKDERGSLAYGRKGLILDDDLFQSSKHKSNMNNKGRNKVKRKTLRMNGDNNNNNKYSNNMSYENKSCKSSGNVNMMTIRSIFNQEYVCRRIANAIGVERIVCQGSVDLTECVNIDSLMLSDDVPLEYRVYTKGSFMDWHKDDLLFDTPQYELVYTISNTSDSMTEVHGVIGFTFHYLLRTNLLHVLD